MHDDPQSTPSHLAPIVIDLLHLVRDLRQQRIDLAEALHAALDLVAQREAALDRVRADNRYLRAQIRAAVSGRTIAEERQQLEAEAAESTSDGARAA